MGFGIEACARLERLELDDLELAMDGALACVKKYARKLGLL